MASSLFLAIILLLHLNCIADAALRQWKFDRQPKISHKEISLDEVDPTLPKVRDLIIDIHNHFRANVDPPASNMLEMSWSEAAANDAERWARACRILEHDSPTGRWVQPFGSCGQNIFISTHLVPWYFAVKTWWLEKDLFTYGAPNGNNDTLINNMEDIGHYTQLVWAATHQVGCSVEECVMDAIKLNSRKKTKQKYYTYICNYCPIGNFMDRLSTPYERGPPCSQCADDCSGKVDYRARKSSLYGKPGVTYKRLLRRLRRRKRQRRQRNSRSQKLLKKSNRHKKRLKRTRALRSQRPSSTGQSHRRSSNDSQYKLCQNSCPVADLWVNCAQLKAQWREWLCDSDDSQEGRERFENCKATCLCDGKIKN